MRSPRSSAEVVSPSTEAVDRRHKMPIYHRAGTGYVWLVNPALKLGEIYVRGPGAHWALHSTYEGDEIVSALPFEVSGCRSPRSGNVRTAFSLVR